MMCSNTVQNMCSNTVSKKPQPQNKKKMEKATKTDDQRCEITFINHIRDTSGTVKDNRRRMQ